MPPAGSLSPQLPTLLLPPTDVTGKRLLSFIRKFPAVNAYRTCWPGSYIYAETVSRCLMPNATPLLHKHKTYDSPRHDELGSLKFLNPFGFHLETDFITVWIIIPGWCFGFVCLFVCFILSHCQAVRSSVEIGCSYIPVCLGQFSVYDDCHDLIC